MTMDDGVGDAEAESGAVWAASDHRHKEVVPKCGRDAWPVVDDVYL